MTTAFAPDPVISPAPAPRKRRGKQKPAHREVHRVDLVGQAMTASKERHARALLRDWRRGAVLVKREQLGLFFREGRLDRNYRNPAEAHLAAVFGAANRCQMGRYQVVGTLRSYWSNRANDFTRTVECSSLPGSVKHQLHVVNRWRAWYVDPRDAKGVPQVPRMKDGSEIALEVRRLARQIMRGVVARHRLPDVSRINAVLDRRAAPLVSWEALGGRTSFPLWLTLPTDVPGRTIKVPLVTTERFEQRLRDGATLLPTVQLNEVRDRKGRSRIVVGLTTDIGLRAQASRAAYQPRTEVLCLDFGLRTMFGSDHGDLLGRGYLDRLRWYEAQITPLAAYRQRHGLRVRCPRYDALVRALRGFVASEVGRVMNRLVETHAPAHLVLERLNFRNPALSKRLNRIVSNCGRAVLQEKLADLEARYGITHEELNPAYSSVTCSNPDCEYPDRRNRRDEVFVCLQCGRTLHADVNAPRTLRLRRTQPLEADVTRHRSVVLQALVGRYNRRHPWPRERRCEGPSGRSCDPRASNPYFTGKTRKVTSSPRPPVAALAPDGKG